jgi:hypothetical protein
MDSHGVKKRVTRILRGSAKGQSPFPQFLPLSFKGEGDTGGEVQSDKIKEDKISVPYRKIYAINY